ncbi:hypothetical protein SAMN05660691_03824 [Rheinheimera pacifica]|uniref:Uncharacterized protein n=1 Tax=Rheinheimera pacifica TaxID=173990 RepID=A0A1H6NHF2_9GAMM|nr:hypothetical protein SAMN05660691_03824 [Rheinheimera pacifica]
MADETQQITCPSCHRKFELTEHNADGIPTENEHYECPYKGCDYSASQRSAGSFSTKRLAK